MRSTVERIDAAAAGAMLARNPRNRPVSEKKVDELARAIQSGEWRLTHQGIALLPGGDLLDGQHRLEAVVRTGRPVDMMVTVLDEDVFDVIDTGRTRSARDALHLAGIGWSTPLPAAIRLGLHYRSPQAALALRGTQPKVTNHSIVEVARQQPAYTQLAPAAERAAIAVGRRGLTPGLLAALVALSEEAGDLIDERSEFALRIIDPILLTPNHPILSLRRWLAVSVSQAPKDRAQLCMYGTIRAWNAYIEKRPLARVLVRLGRDGAPQVSTG